VRGAVRLAADLGLSPLVIGLTVVAYGTSAPELTVTALAAAAGRPDVALGNVVGSNILNVLLILGVSAALAPLAVSRRLVWIDVPIMIAVSAAVLVLALDGGIGRADGAALVAGFVVYSLLAVRRGRRENAGAAVRPPPARRGARARRMLASAGLVAFGLALLVAGSHALVTGAVAIARALGVSELVIGLTVVAAGTSLPEIATSVLAAVRGARDIAVGNVIGSNLFNLLGVLGLAGLLAPGGIPIAPAALHFDLPVMLAVAVACLPIFLTGHVIARWEGLLFLGYYAAYTCYLILAAVEHDALPAFSATMTLFVMPLTAVTLLVVTARAVRARMTAR
jgi:cation:H+ antiporter